jgi:hypothetical protein
MNKSEAHVGQQVVIMRTNEDMFREHNYKGKFTKGDVVTILELNKHHDTFKAEGEDETWCTWIEFADVQPAEPAILEAPKPAPTYYVGQQLVIKETKDHMYLDCSYSGNHDIGDVVTVGEIHPMNNGFFKSTVEVGGFATWMMFDYTETIVEELVVEVIDINDPKYYVTFDELSLEEKRDILYAWADKPSSIEYYQDFEGWKGCTETVAPRCDNYKYRFTPEVDPNTLRLAEIEEELAALTLDLKAANDELFELNKVA